MRAGHRTDRWAMAIAAVLAALLARPLSGPVSPPAGRRPPYRPAQLAQHTPIPSGASDQTSVAEGQSILPVPDLPGQAETEGVESVWEPTDVIDDTAVDMGLPSSEVCSTGSWLD